MDNARSILPVARGDEPECNPSSNPFFADIVAQRYGRRSVVKSGVALAVGALIVGPALAQNGRESSGPQPHGKRPARLGFAPVPHSTADAVVVPDGYRVQVLFPEGEPLTSDAPPYIPGDFNTGADREQQAGAHHEGLWFFPFLHGRAGNERGLLCVNHENINLELIHQTGGSFEAGNFRPIEDEVRKEIASHGVAIAAIKRNRGGEWRLVKDRYNRRITAATPIEFTGPARGTDFLRTRYSPGGKRTRGTLNNCANGCTPWGTYLSCEENWAGYFFNTGARPREQTRYGVPAAATSSSYGWGTRVEDQYTRFDATPKANDASGDYRNEPNCFGWVVEIDPFDPKSTPKEHTALGRLAREDATVAPAKAGRPLVVYMGDDSRGEYLYKFVSKDNYRPDKGGGDLL